MSADTFLFLIVLVWCLREDLKLSWRKKKWDDLTAEIDLDSDGYIPPRE